MNDVINVGPFMIQRDTAILAIGAIIGYALIRFIYKDKKLTDITINAVLIILIMWRFGGILFRFNLFLNNPVYVLSIPGTKYSLITGCLLAIVYLLYQRLKHHVSLMRVSDILSVFIINVLLIKSLFVWEYGAMTTMPWGVSIQDPQFNYHPLNLYTLILLVIIGVILYIKIKTLSTGQLAIYFIISYGLGKLLISNLDVKQKIVLGLQVNQWMYIFLVVIGLTMMWWKNRLK